MELFSQRKYINALLLIAFLTLLGCYLLAYRQIHHALNAYDWVAHSHKVVEISNQTILNLGSLENTINKYAFSKKGNINSVPKYIQNLKNNYSILKDITVDNKTQQYRLKLLEPVLLAEINFLNNVYKYLQANNNEAALKLLSNVQLQALSEQAANLLTDFNQDEIRLLEIRNAISLADLEAGHRLFTISLTISALLFIISILLLNYQLNLRFMAEMKQRESENELMLSHQQLRESEERFVLATRGSNIGLWDWKVNTDDVYLSPCLKDMLGYNDNEFPNSLKHFLKQLHPNDLGRVQALIRAHIENSIPYDIEYRLKLKSGEYRWFRAVGKASLDETRQTTRMSGSLQDIHEKKIAQQRLATQYAITEILSKDESLEEAGQKLLKAACENLNWDIGIIWSIDKNLKVLECISYWQKSNIPHRAFEHATRSTHFKYGEGIPGRIWETVKPVWVSEVKLDPQFFRAKEADNLNINTVLAFPILIQNKVLGVIEFFSIEKHTKEQTLIDMMVSLGPQIGLFIQRKQSEIDLRESEAYKTAILSEASDSILTLNENGEILSCNPKTNEFLSLSDNKLLNSNIDNYVPGLKEKLKTHETRIPLEFLAIKKDGESFPVEVTISKMSLNKQNIYICILRDITERKKVDKLKNEFVSVVSHELRTPLTSIRGSLGLVLGGKVGELTDKTRDLLNIANNNCERLLLLINDILDIEKIEAGKMNFNFQIIDINTLAKDGIEVNQMYAKKYNIKIKSILLDKEVAVNVDPDRTVQVLSNLISNAAKFSPQGSVITVKLEKVENSVRLAVTDQGSGISQDFQTKIFQKFSQADSSSTRGKGGTGLGLSISRAIVEKMGGEMNFYSEEGKGSTFYFDLPIWNKQKSKADQPIHKRLNNAKRLLICEDDESQAAYLQALLAAAGFDVDLAYSAKQAKRLLSENTYHALLLDLILPDTDGITLIKELRKDKNTQDLPIIVTSVMSQTGKTLMNGDVFQVLDWLDKPINLPYLLATINKIKKDQNQLPKILYVEDDVDTQKIVNSLLETRATVMSAFNIHEAKQLLSNEKFDLVILDLLLPDGNGVDLLPLLAKYKLPTIVYSVTELNHEYAKYVTDALVKSKTSNQQLLNTINDILKAPEGANHEG